MVFATNFYLHHLSVPYLCTMDYVLGWNSKEARDKNLLTFGGHFITFIILQIPTFHCSAIKLSETLLVKGSSIILNDYDYLDTEYVKDFFYHGNL